MENPAALSISMDAGSESEDATLLRVARSDPAAVGELYKRYLPRI